MRLRKIAAINYLQTKHVECRFCMPAVLIVCNIYFCVQAASIHINPLYLMLPVTVAASFAFMLPVATPPNAIVYAYGQMNILDMVNYKLP